MGKSTISTGPFSIAMLVYQRVYGIILPIDSYFSEGLKPPTSFVKPYPLDPFANLP